MVGCGLCGCGRGVGLVGVIADGLVICDVGLGLILGLWTWLHFGDCDLGVIGFNVFGLCVSGCGLVGLRVLVCYFCFDLCVAG